MTCSFYFITLYRQQSKQHDQVHTIRSEETFESILQVIGTVKICNVVKAENKKT